jgi:DNA-binding LytR/AlgR family response regulator
VSDKTHFIMTVLKVLIVEDDPIQASALTLMLEERGHLVVGKARSGERALKLFAETVPDLVLLDVNITGKPDNGIEVGRMMLAQRPLPLVFLSGYPEFMGNPELPKDTVFFPKPFNENDLESAIETALSHYQQQYVT